MKTSVDQFDICNELDIVLANRRASQICELTGIPPYSRTSFITAISEICRNCLQHAVSGSINFYVYSDGSKIEAVISDLGPGITDIDNILNKPYRPGTVGCGLQYSKKLVDLFSIQSSRGGTNVTLGMKITSKTIPINKIIAKGWAKYFQKEKPVSPYEEIKRQNIQLLEFTNQLRLKSLETEEQLEEIRNLNEQLNKSNQDLEDFAYTISHDLKSPINNLKLLIDIMEMSNRGPIEHLNDFKKLIGRLDQILVGLVEIIDLKNNPKGLAKDVSFENILSHVREELLAKTNGSSADIQYDFELCPTIFYYEAYLHSILLNLVGNAIKYKDPERTPVIRISTGIAEGYVLLQVQDNGIGINMDKIGANLFKPFRRFTKKADGKGIGLHIVKSMVEKNGGRIEVESEPGKGSLFRIYLMEYARSHKSIVQSAIEKT